jgi:Bacteriophage holin family
MTAEYIDILIDLLDNTITKLSILFSYIFGYIMILLVYIASTFGDKVQLFNYILVCMVIDLFWGIASNYVKGTFGLSKCFTKTAMKMCIYLSLFAGCVLIEQIIDGRISILTRTVSAILCCGELISIIAHILIIRPNMPVLRLFSRYLSKEIRKKLKLQREDVDTIFDKH